jgi:hypothetical protein
MSATDAHHLAILEHKRKQCSAAIVLLMLISSLSMNKNNKISGNCAADAQNLAILTHNLNSIKQQVCY